MGQKGVLQLSLADVPALAGQVIASVCGATMHAVGVSGTGWQVSRVSVYDVGDESGVGSILPRRLQVDAAELYRHNAGLKTVLEYMYSISRIIFINHMTIGRLAQLVRAWC